MLPRPLWSSCAEIDGRFHISMHGVAKATVVASQLYATTVWWSLTMAEDRNKFEPFLNRTRRISYMYFPGDSQAVSEMVREAEDKLLSALIYFTCCVVCSRQPLIASILFALRNMTLSYPQKMTKLHP